MPEGHGITDGHCLKKGTTGVSIGPTQRKFNGVNLSEFLFFYLDEISSLIVGSPLKIRLEV